MKEQLTTYFKTEYNLTRNAILGEDNPIRRFNIIDFAIQRCLGACQFADVMGMDFAEVETIYNEWKERLEGLA